MKIDELYEKYYSEMVNWGTRVCGNKHNAEELVQEAFLKAMKNEEVFDGLSESQARSWIYTTVKNMYVDKVRHLKKETLSDEMIETDSIQNDYNECEIMHLIDMLPKDERVIFKLYCSGYTSKKIGELMDMPAGTVRSKLSTARKQLKKLYNI